MADQQKKLILTNFYMTSQDREVLEQIAEQEGTNGMAGVVRRLIREEGRRRGLLPAITMSGDDNLQPLAQVQA